MPEQPIPHFFDDLAASHDHAWALLARGVADRRSPFHAPTVATIGIDGRPRARVVILRGCDAAGRSVRFNTDHRTEKAAELARDPRVSLTAYDAASKIQLRLEGTASVHIDDAIADAAWEASRPFSRVCYGTAPAPGTSLQDGGAFSLPSADEAIAAGRANFSTVVIAVETLEWLYLAHAGHRRARFVGPNGGQWLAP